MAFPAVVQTKTSGAFASAVTSTSLQFDTTPTSGNLVVAFVAIDKAPGTITVPTGWTKHQEHTTGTGVSGCICSWPADGTNPNHTWSWPNSGCRPTIVMYELSVSGGSPAVFATAKDTTNASSSERTSGTIDAGSTTEADSLLIAGVFNDTHTSWDSGTRSWTNGLSDLTFYGGGSGFSGEPGVITAYKEIATAGGSTATVFSYTGDLQDQIIGFSMVIAPTTGSSSDDLTAAEIEVNTTVEAPALGQVHALSAAEIGVNTTVDAPAVGQVHSLSATGLSVGATVEAPALAEGAHPLTADDISVTSTVGSPVIGQIHGITADEITVAVTSGSPALGQVHVLTADGVAAGTPTVGAPELVEADDVDQLVAAEISVAPTVESPTLGQVHALIAGAIQVTVRVESALLFQRAPDGGVLWVDNTPAASPFEDTEAEDQAWTPITSPSNPWV